MEQGTACTVNVNAGSYTFAILCSAATGANMIDNCVIDSTILSTAGQIVLTSGLRANMSLAAAGDGTLTIAVWPTYVGACQRGSGPRVRSPTASRR